MIIEVESDTFVCDIFAFSIFDRVHISVCRDEYRLDQGIGRMCIDSLIDEESSITFGFFEYVERVECYIKIITLLDICRVECIFEFECCW